MTSETFPYTIPKTGKPISDQDALIEDLTIALGLIETGTISEHREQGAKIINDLINRPIEEPANRIHAMTEARSNVNAHSTLGGNSQE